MSINRFVFQLRIWMKLSLHSVGWENKKLGNFCRRIDKRDGTRDEEEAEDK